MATTHKCAHASCRCNVDAGQQYCSPSCQQQAQQASSRQQSQQGSPATQASGRCNCGHAPCQHSA